MSTYRKKPVEVEARQYPRFPGHAVDADEEYDAYQEEVRSLTEWAGARFDGGTYDIVIYTPSSEMHAVEGDWIIRGVGEVYVCKPDIFAETYEEVTR